MEERKLIPASEFCIHHQVEIGLIHSLQEYGLIEIISEQGNDYLDEEKLNELEKMVRLHDELHVNMEGIDVALHLLEQLETTQKELSRLRDQLKFYI
jgi:transposase